MPEADEPSNTIVLRLKVDENTTHGTYEYVLFGPVHCGPCGHRTPPQFSVVPWTAPVDRKEE